MSAVVVDTINKFVRTPGSLGDTQGWHAALAAAPVGCIGLQLALRAYFDTFSFAGPVTPYTRGFNGNYAGFSVSSVTWENIFALGLGFTADHPVRGASGVLPTASKGFFGLVTGRDVATSSASIFSVNVNNNAPLGNIASWCRFGASVGFVAYHESAILHRQTRAASSLFASTTTTSAFTSGQVRGDPPTTNFDTGVGRWLNTFPVNPTDGAKFTLGLEFRKNPLNYAVELRVFVDTRSIHEDNLIDVFDSYEFVSGTVQVNRSTASIDADDAWIDDSGNLVLPGYFLHRNGLPGQAFVVKPVKYRYITP